jgi:hypothetical protein
MGGGAGGGWGFSAAAVGSGAPLINNSLAYSNVGNCRAAVPTGFIAGGYDSLKTPGGLPGMNGGSRRRSRRSQRGGRYGFTGESPGAGGAPWGAPMATATRVPCEASYTPVPAAHLNLNARDGGLWSGMRGVPAGAIPAQFGGAVHSLPAPYAGAFAQPAAASAAGGVPASITVPTARYEDLPAGEPGIRSSAGTNLSIHRPLEWNQMTPACVKTGGGRRSSRSRKAKKSKKSKAKKAKRSRGRSNKH